MEKPAPDEIERLLLDLKDDRRDVRSRAAYELGKNPDNRAVPPLIAALGDPDKFVRSWAAGALGKFGPPAVPPLLDVIDGGNTAAGYYAALALGELDHLRAIPLLAKAIRVGDYDIRPSAAEALSKFGDANTLPDRILSEPGLSARERLDLLDSVRGLVYADEEVKLNYTLPDPADLCATRLNSADAAVTAGAEEVLRALIAAPPTPVEAVSAPLETAEPRAEPMTPPALHSTADAMSSDKPEPPAAQPPAQPSPAPREDAKPKRGFWSKLLNRPSGDS